MENNHISELIPDYLDGLLDAGNKEMVDRHLKDCPQCLEELRETEILLRAMDKGELSPPPSLRNHFESALEREKEAMDEVMDLPTTSKKNGAALQILKVAASLALLLGAYYMGVLAQSQKGERELALLQEEGLQMKQTAMLSLMENRSASKRIQGVGLVGDFERLDPEIIKALGDRLLYDENDNVRLTAFEALSKFTDSKAVKQLMIEALESERNPSIQIAIIQVLSEIQEKKAAAPMKRLLEQESTQPFIKEQIEAVLPSLT